MRRFRLVVSRAGRRLARGYRERGCRVLGEGLWPPPWVASGRYRTCFTLARHCQVKCAFVTYPGRVWIAGNVIVISGRIETSTWDKVTFAFSVVAATILRLKDWQGRQNAKTPMSEWIW